MRFCTKFITAIFCTLFITTFFLSAAHAGNVSTLSYSGTNVTTAAYVTLVASTPILTQKLIICDSSGQILKIAVGAALSEVDLFTVPLSACFVYPLSYPLPAGSRLSLRAISATASTGFSSVSFLP